MRSSPSSYSLASPSLQLEDRIGTDHLQKLMAVFRSHCGGREKGKMSINEFKTALAQLLGRETGDKRIALLCAKVGAAVDTVLA